MAKLSKMEISAIASKIAQNIREQVREENNKLTSEEEFIKWMRIFKTSSKYKAILAINKAKENFNIEFSGQKRKNHWGGETVIVENKIKVAARECNVSVEGYVKELKKADGKDIDEKIANANEEIEGQYMGNNPRQH